MSDDKLLDSLPEGLHQFCDAAFLEDMRNGHIPEFSWYSPRFIPQAQTQRTEHFQGNTTNNNASDQTFTDHDNVINTNNSCSNNSNSSNAYGKTSLETNKEQTVEVRRCVRSEHEESIALTSNVDRFFAPLMHIALSDNLDGKYNEEDGSVLQQVAQRRRALHLDWQHVTPIEEMWNGPPLSTKVPQAKDFENILLDRENDYDDGDNVDDDNIIDEFDAANTYKKNVA